MTTSLECPICTMPEILRRDDELECATCGHEWLAELSDGLDDIRDANGTLLANGDDVTIIKAIKLNGKAGGVKVGTKIKGIRLVSGDHPIDGKIDGRGIVVRAEFVKKA